MRFFMKQPHPNPSAKGISRCLLACLILLPLAPAAAQKVAATISSTKPGGPASTGHPTWLPPDVDEKVPAVEETAPRSASWSSSVTPIDSRPQNLSRTSRLTSVDKHQCRSGASSITWSRYMKCEKGIWESPSTGTAGWPSTNFPVEL